MDFIFIIYQKGNNNFLHQTQHDVQIQQVFTPQATGGTITAYCLQEEPTRIRRHGYYEGREKLKE